jgi:hypothetical protein
VTIEAPEPGTPPDALYPKETVVTHDANSGYVAQRTEYPRTVNRPWLKGAKNQTVKAGDTVTMELEAVNPADYTPEGPHAVTITCEEKPAGSTFDGSAFTWDVDENTVLGPYYVTFVLEDGVLPVRRVVRIDVADTDGVALPIDVEYVVENTESANIQAIQDSESDEITVNFPAETGLEAGEKVSFWFYSIDAASESSARRISTKAVSGSDPIFVSKTVPDTDTSEPFSITFDAKNIDGKGTALPEGNYAIICEGETSGFVGFTDYTNTVLGIESSGPGVGPSDPGTGPTDPGTLTPEIDTDDEGAPAAVVPINPADDVTIDINTGAVTVVVPELTQSVIDTAIQSAIDAGGTEPTVVIRIDDKITGESTEVKEVRVEIRVDNLKTVAESKVENVKIVSDVGEVALNTDAVKDLIARAEGQAAAAVEILVAKDDEARLEELTPEQQETLRGDEKVREVYEVSLLINTAKVEDFETRSGKLTIGLPYELKVGEVGSGVWTIYVGEDGSIERMTEGRKYAGSLSIFETNHLSVYAVTYDAETPVPPDDGQNDNVSDDSGGGCDTGAAFLAVLSLAAVGLLGKKK